ncbi:hypothetical protein Pla110_37770 [Polystyrenella longa]|uniref:DNA alkylation repair enzyme n=1 Tax=Polystyrenella longa TaxID=2528007 RepID=A0A518CS29_9PLAN|nr:DNA alkylation repair protein [Polystyrenella longa]QDU82023.1 hypothetical protein Pla110_37770 [Polystyrenella longa]
MAEPLKNYYSRDYIAKLATTLRECDPRINPVHFRKRIFDASWEEKELKERMSHITISLREVLPDDFPESVSILGEAIERMPSDKNSGYLGLYFPEFVALYGRQDWETSLPALAWFTRFSSSEFAVRPFILDDPERMMQQMRYWAIDENEHVRRLSSEGCRPRLPWAPALPLFKLDPQPVLDLLGILKRDEARYVQKSVANNLNDISKDHPEQVLETAERWQGLTSETDWIIKHACRTLLKQSHPRALSLFGYDARVKELTDFTVNQTEINLGDELEFAVSFHVKRKCKLRVEYVIDYLKKNGTLAPKVFQWTEREFESGHHELQKKQRFTPLTTRQHYPGAHHIRVRINGREFESKEFLLIT